MKIVSLRAATAAAVLAATLALAACGERTNREDFTTLINGKTAEQVRKDAGKPDSIEEASAERHVWTYTSRTFDIQQMNKMDNKTIVVFTRSPEGKMVVAEVKFE